MKPYHVVLCLVVFAVLSGCTASQYVQRPQTNPADAWAMRTAPSVHASFVQKIEAEQARAALPAASADRSLATSPCDDSLYLSLKQKPLDQMSDREHDYFSRKDQECSEFQKAQLTAEPAKENAETLKKATNAYTTWLIIGGVVSAALIVWSIAEYNSAMNDIDGYSYMQAPQSEMKVPARQGAGFSFRW